jgi:hypothetical protein
LEDPKVTRSIPATPLARRRPVLGAALLASAALGVGLLSACSSGQITQTSTQVAAVPGVSVNSADGKIALRDGTVSYADEYKAGSTVPLNVRLFNNSTQAVKLTGVTTANGDVVLVGGAPGAPSSAPVTPSSQAASPTGSGSKKPSGSSSATAPESPSSPASPTPAAVGSSKISVNIPVGGYVALSRDSQPYLAVGKLTGEAIKSGGALQDVAFTFTYADGSTTTIKLDELPMTPPLTPLPKPSSVVHDEDE